jgi:hypothetical protein
LIKKGIYANTTNADITLTQNLGEK